MFNQVSYVLKCASLAIIPDQSSGKDVITIYGLHRYSASTAAELVNYSELLARRIEENGNIGNITHMIIEREVSDPLKKEWAGRQVPYESNTVCFNSSSVESIGRLLKKPGKNGYVSWTSKKASEFLDNAEVKYVWKY